MKIAVPKETLSGENRVALIPESCAKLVKAGLEVVIQSGAGDAAAHTDTEYTKAGARTEGDVGKLLGEADLIAMVNPPRQLPDGSHEVDRMREGAFLVTFLEPLTDHDLIRKLASKRITGTSMELVPRITRAQSMDALSSMANIAGYKAVLMAAETLPKMFPMMMTAAGTISPAKVFIIGAGVAGLQAIATAKRLGAVVSAYDVRPAVREQVESLGGKFVEMELDTAAAEDKGGYAKEQGEDFLRKQREMMARVVAENDVVITTAAIPGKKAPILVTADIVRGMKPGSVIIDLAAERGGNCELTQCGQRVVENAVTILGPANVPSSVPYHASQMYARNILTIVNHFVKDGALTVDFTDEITAGCVVTHEGEIVHPRVRELMGLEPLPPAAPAAAESGESQGSNG